jgi:hypothetical protein
MFKPILRAVLLTTALAIAAPSQAGSPIFSGVPIDAIVMRSGATAPKIKKLKKVPSLGVVLLRRDGFRFGVRRELRSYDNDHYGGYDYRLLISRNASGIKKLRAALKSNPATRRALAKVNINRIIAADVYSNGSIRVYVY